MEEQTNKELDLLPYVLNENNKLITQSVLEAMLKRFGVNHSIKHLQNFQQAMTHESYVIRDLAADRLAKLVKEKNLKPIPNELTKKAIPLQKESYERLEFLGDAVIHLILAEYIYKRYPDEKEGFMTKLRTKIENGEVLAIFAKVLGLHNYVLIARNLEQIGGREKNYNILEDAFEAFIGCLFLESDLETCRKLVVTLMEQEMDFSALIHIETNFKDLLLQYYHKMRWPDPEYHTVCAIDVSKDNSNKKMFKMNVKGYVKNNNNQLEWDVVGEGMATSKKKAEQISAQNALIKFGVIKENADEEEYEEVYDETFTYN
jgi:dsRNA-specific ribonuclease